MRDVEIRRRRVVASLLSGPRPGDPVAVVGHLLALQAQDLGQSLWAVGSRTASPRRSRVEAAYASGELVRTWPMRGTLHVVRRADVRWLLALSAPRMGRVRELRHRQLDLTPAELLRGEDVVGAALATRPHTRAELFALLADAGVDPGGQRGTHVVGHLAQQGLLVLGPRVGGQVQLTLLDTPPADDDRDQGLGEVARRYLTGHGPATAHDLAWWAGLTLADARRAFALLGDGFAHDGELAFPDLPLPPASTATLLLAAFDELLIAYADRSAVLAGVPLEVVLPGRNGMFLPVVVRGGRVVGTWRAATGEVTPTGPPVETGAAWRRYERFRDG